MMINKRLIGTVSESKKYIAGNVALQWCSLAANMVLMTGIASLLAALFSGKVDSRQLAMMGAVAGFVSGDALPVRWGRPGWGIFLLRR